MSATPADPLLQALVQALEMLRKAAPRDLADTMEYAARIHDLKLPREPTKALLKHLRDCGPNDEMLHNLTLAIHTWDHREGETWTARTAPHTKARRALVLKLLGFPPDAFDELDTRILRLTPEDIPTVIAETHEDWYSQRKKETVDFYWNHYTQQLAQPRGNWTKDAINILDLEIDDVLGRLSDPRRAEIYPVKGLVMGYVQSGKTSHFSGLIAKAADAGYRLIIVLAGTLDILRKQTQRRIDKEIVGTEILGKEEYGADFDWSNFVSHGGLPSALGAFDWERLTNKDDDYKTLSRHLTLLEFRSADRTRPFNDPVNLRSASAKLAIIKKVPARLNKLCDDLEDLRELRNRLEHVPTLVIDDESDQASINTIDQTNPEKKGKRTGTNAAIVRLLSLLPRAQYVGYTATPFANVFVNPEDAADLFPKDFIVSLPRPAGYMGVLDFYDFGKEFKDGDYHGNRNAFVRPVEGENDDPGNLPKAIDSFVLAGAIKLFRAARNSSKYRFRHHTMLVHHSSARLAHENDREAVAKIFRAAARYHTQPGLRALRNLFDSDFVPVSKIRAPDDPFPKSFDELQPFISQCLSRIQAGKPVRIVNGDEKHRDDTPDFDAEDVWAILVGGTKLSRGYTVEGLTVSYYRRPAGTGDTLMQMGRWFGFRTGYRDLVRLFVGRHERKGKTTVDLYEAFGAICLDEEALRADLRKYAAEGIKPRQVPPLVRQHLSSLPPTARNKMFNAEIAKRDFGGEWTEKTSAPTETKLLEKNRSAARALLQAAHLGREEVVEFVNAKGVSRKFDALFGRVAGVQVLQFLSSYRWAGGRDSVALERDYIERALAAGELTEWWILVPQADSLDEIDLGGGVMKSLSVIHRSRVSATRFGVFSEPRHRDAAEALAGGQTISKPSDALKSRLGATKPTLIIYFVRDKNEPRLPESVGFGIQYDGEKKDQAIEWTVRDSSNEDSVVVNRPIKKSQPATLKRNRKKRT